MCSDTIDHHNDGEEETSPAEKNDCCAELEEVKNKLLFARADFENFKKRISKEKQEWIASGQSQILIELLPLVDDFDRALEEQRKQTTTHHDAWLKGYELMYASLHKLLEKHHVREIKEVLVFDPTIHEAVMQVDSPDHASGTIVQVLQKGYLFNDVVLRPAKVSVAK